MVPAKKSSSAKKPNRSAKQPAQADALPEQATRPEPQLPAPAGPQPPVPQTREELMLPKGGLVALRTSGGTGSAAREVIVYPDGRVTYDAHGKPDSRRPRTLTDARIAEMRHTLERINFLRLPSVEGTPSTQGEPSGERVQIAARLGTRTNSVEYSKQNLPAPLAPLVDQLSALLPQERQDQASETSGKA